MPALDAHAHLAPDVTPAQVRQLGHCHVFAVTRTLAEAAHVQDHPAPTITWGLGVHPGVTRARNSFDLRLFKQLIKRFALVGEVGIDARAGHREQQSAIFRAVLRICADEPVLLSIHSSGATSTVLDLLTEQPHPGVILHWWNPSDPRDLDRALKAGAYFSVNAAMDAETLTRIPITKVLTETDFPAPKVNARHPGDIAPIEERLASIHGITPAAMRATAWTNLHNLATRCGAIERLPNAFAQSGPG